MRRPGVRDSPDHQSSRVITGSGHNRGTPGNGHLPNRVTTVILRISRGESIVNSLSFLVKILTSSLLYVMDNKIND